MLRVVAHSLGLPSPLSNIRRRMCCAAEAAQYSGIVIRGRLSQNSVSGLPSVGPLTWLTTRPGKNLADMVVVLLARCCTRRAARQKDGEAAPFLRLDVPNIKRGLKRDFLTAALRAEAGISDTDLIIGDPYDASTIEMIGVGDSLLFEDDKRGEFPDRR